MSQLFIEIFTDESGVSAVSRYDKSGKYLLDLCSRSETEELILSESEKCSSIVTSDIRPFFDFGFKEEGKIRDLRVYFGVDQLEKVLPKISTSVSNRIKELESIIEANRRAMRSAKIDLREHSLYRAITPSVMRDHFLLRAKCLYSLFQTLSEDEQSDCRSSLLRSLYSMEKNGIFVDVELAKKGAEGFFGEDDRGFFSGILSSQRNNLLKINLNPQIGKTGRIKTSGGFSCMNVKKGSNRSVIKSRFVGGSIFSFDYNAIDYRSIVGSLEDKSFQALYEGCEDFHRRSAGLLLKRPDEDVSDLHREIMKQSIYVVAYGGTDKTLAKKLGIDEDKAKKHLERIQKAFDPICKFRKDLFNKFQSTGGINLPSGRFIPVSSDSHEGKVLGIYAQSFSSLIFERAMEMIDKFLRESHCKSMMIFPVHDELIFDMHPEEKYKLSSKIVEIMELPDKDLFNVKFKAKSKEGKNYEEAAG